MEIVYAGLKKWMIQSNHSTVDLDWNMLKKHNISMSKLLHWEMYGTPARRKKTMVSRQQLLTRQRDASFAYM